MMSPQTMNVLVTGGTGFIGTRLVAALAARGHSVRALVRPGSAHRLPEHVVTVAGNALNAASVTSVAEPTDTLVHLVGTPHPNPSKAEEFRRVDVESIRASVAAAKERHIAHLVYVSVAHPAPAMRAYVAARVEGEAAIAEAGLTATILRPWYVLGPGHWWPVVLIPFLRDRSGAAVNARVGAAAWPRHGCPDGSRARASRRVAAACRRTAYRRGSRDSSRPARVSSHVLPDFRPRTFFASPDNRTPL
jgi:uncharacterized protein YbjT (DUF2867 family)